MKHSLCRDLPVEDLCRYINHSASLIGLKTLHYGVEAWHSEGEAPYDAADRDLLIRVARRMGYTHFGASLVIVRKIGEALNARHAGVDVKTIEGRVA